MQDRLALINVDRDNYMLDGVEDDEKQAVTVIYDGIKTMTVKPFISNVVENGKLQVRGMFSLRAVFDDYWYDNDDLDTDIFVDEYLRCQFQNESTTFDKLLDILLPLADESKVEEIRTELENIGVKDASVKYDTYTYKYVVESDIHSFLYKEASNEDLEVANYDGLVCLYKDYPFEELGLKPVVLYLGANLAYKDTKGPVTVNSAPNRQLH